MQVLKITFDHITDKGGFNYNLVVNLKDGLDIIRKKYLEDLSFLTD